MAALTAKRRNALPAAKFAGPDRSYPIDTPARARSALSRASANASPAVQAQIKRKVARDYPGIKQANPPKAAGRGNSNSRLASQLTQRLNAKDR